MKHTIAVLSVLFLLAVPAFAGVPPKSELALVGEYIQVEEPAEGESSHPWVLSFGLLFPVSQGGKFLIGPEVTVADDDLLNKIGAGFEWDLVSAKFGPFVGAGASYFQRSEDGLDDYTVTARAGLKIGIREGAAIKVYAFDVVDGRGKDSTNLSVAAGLVARF